MRVLHLVDSVGVYGKEHVILELMAQQARSGLVPILGSITRRGEDKPILWAVREGGLEGVTFVVRRPGDPWRMRAAIAARRIDLVHTHDYKGSLILAPLRRLGLVPPLVRTIHGLFSTGISKLRVYHALDRSCLRWHDAVVAVTADIRAQTAVDLTVIENGISPPSEPPAGPSDPDLDAARAFGEDALVLGALARLAPKKNLGALLEAVAVLGQRGLPAKLMILGEGPSRAALETEAARLGIADRVRLPGFKSDVHAWLQLFDCYVQPSLIEGLPISLLQAMHAGVPLLVTPIAGMKDIIAAGAAIEIPFEGHAIAEVIRDLWDTEAGRSRTRAAVAAARQLVRTRYGGERMAAAYAAVYRRVIEGRQPRPRMRAE